MDKALPPGSLRFVSLMLPLFAVNLDAAIFAINEADPSMERTYLSLHHDPLAHPWALSFLHQQECSAVLFPTNLWRTPVKQKDLFIV